MQVVLCYNATMKPLSRRVELKKKSFIDDISGQEYKCEKCSEIKPGGDYTVTTLRLKGNRPYFHRLTKCRDCVREERLRKTTELNPVES